MYFRTLDLILLVSKLPRVFIILLLIIAKLTLFVYSVNHWKNTANRRKYMDNFAKKQGFDPLIPHEWYSITAGSVMREKVG